MNDEDLPDLVGKLGEFAKSKTVLNGSVYIVIGLWVAFGVVALTADRAQAGLIGDSFGALNTLFSGLALLGVFYAVLLQRQEMDIARQSARDSEEARQKTESLLVRQAEALLASAQLNALDSLLRSNPRGSVSDIPVSANGRTHYVSSAAVLRQHLRIVLHRIGGPQIGPEAMASNGASMFRQYVFNLTCDIRAQLRAAIFSSEWGTSRNLRFRLQEELWLLLGHDGMAGSSDGRLAELGLSILDKVQMKAVRAEDTRDDDQIRQAVEGALSLIEVNARTGV